MFKLVGKEHFKVGAAKCTISIDACSGFAYEYTLEVNGKPLEKFRENQNKIQKSWSFTLGSQNSTPFRIVLGTCVQFFIKFFYWKTLYTTLEHIRCIKVHFKNEWLITGNGYCIHTNDFCYIIIETHVIPFRERHTECLGEWACGGNDSEYN